MKGEKLLDGVSFKLYTGDKIGIIGPNGSGKSTLLKMIINQVPYDGGNIKVYGQIGYLPQDLSFEEEKTIAELLREFEYDGELIKLLNIFKIRRQYEQKISTLSGGEKTRTYLVKLILSGPDILILDEPTNHLDYRGMDYLENFIKEFEGGVLIVSHDRYFLDQTVTKIMALEEKCLKNYSGNYSFYKKTKDQELRRQRIEYENYRKEKKKLEEAARKQMERSNRYNNMTKNDFYRGKAAKIAKKSKAIYTRIEQLDEVRRLKDEQTIDVAFDSDMDKTGSILVRGDNLAKSYGERILFQNLNLEISSGNKIGLIGENGVGKSTLLKGIVGIENMDGDLYISPSTKMGYFSQELTNLDDSISILEELKKVNTDETYVRTLLGCMLFTGDDVFKTIGNLSLGERARVSFLKLVLGGYNLLILDEPVNFLDISSREAIEELLLDYEGAILFTSHDRYFTKKLAKEIWHMANGGLTRYLGNYQYYLDRQKRMKESKTNVSREHILLIEMEMSNLSFKLLSCSEEEKESLERRYFQLASKLKRYRD